MDWTTTSKQILFFILRLMIVLLLIFVAFAVGAMIGYSIIGDGANPTDVFKLELWQYIFEFIFN